MNITQRTCKLSNSINLRAEKHGDTDVTAIDISISELNLNEEEFNILVRSDIANTIFFEHSAKPPEPVFPHLGPLSLTDKIEGARVVFFVGLDRTPISFAEAKLKNVRLQLLPGPVAQMSCTVQALPNFDKGTSKLLEKINGTVEISIEVEGYGAQQALNLTGTDKPKRGRPPKNRAQQPATH